MTGIHYSSIGYGERARLIADGLVAAFPGPAVLGQASKTLTPARHSVVRV